MDPATNLSALHYGPRAHDYVTSTVHAAGADLDQIEQFVRGRTLGRVIDIGCGGGHVSYRAAPHVGAIVACDVTPSMLDAVQRTAAERGLTNLSVQHTPAEHLPFPDGSFDAALCRFTCHHWQDWEAGLREARRVLKPGAPALFIDIVATGDAACDTHLQAVELLRDLSHVRDYSVAEWTAALGRAGFAIDSLTRRTLRMDFPVWIARTNTEPLLASAVRRLQDAASAPVRRHFAIDAAGSFDIVSAAFELTAAEVR